MIREFILIRTDFTTTSTIGQLTIDGVHVCYILEDVVRPVGAKKVHGATAIPYGRYKLSIEKSPRFGKMLPRLANVPGYLGILVHSGNSHLDTEGCLITGTSKKKDWVNDSRLALLKFQKLLQGYLDVGDECWITIRK